MTTHKKPDSRNLHWSETMTRKYGECGIGWKYEIVDLQIKPVTQSRGHFIVQVNLYVRDQGTWGPPIPGIGGCTTAIMKKNGLYSTTAFMEMAVAEAMSLPMMALGADSSPPAPRKTKVGGAW